VIDFIPFPDDADLLQPCVERRNGLPALLRCGLPGIIGGHVAAFELTHHALP
jgi:hypothetical protein